MTRKFAHTFEVQITVESSLKGASDVTKHDVLNAVINDIEDVYDSMHLVETHLLPSSQEDFRANPEACPRCGHEEWIVLTPWDLREQRVFQNRKCNKCDEGWTVCFEAKSYLSHSD